MKNLTLVLLLSLMFGTGCVMTPTGDIIGAPVDVGVEAEVDFLPRVHIGSRSAVTVWLHPNYYVHDAYPIAQRHCSRWGMFARPRYDWSHSARAARYLDYTCVRHRPHLAYPHFRRGQRPHHRYANPGRRVITPKPRPRVQPIRRRGTFGRIHNPRVPRRDTVIERGKPWEHNGNKNRVVTPKPRRGTVVERGKPWEHNSDKNLEVDRVESPRYNLPGKLPPKKRSSFGSLKSTSVKQNTVKSTYLKSKPRFSKSSGLKLKSKPKKRKSLRL